ncbi:MAG: hypothetical protein AAF492_26110, partial [Verrucomicrobiota bacterium]
VDEYRVFVLPTGLTEDRDLIAVEFRPGNPEIVHHAVLSYDTSGEGRRKDAQDSAAGFESFGGFGVPAQAGLALPGWVPGATPRFFPPGTGIRLPKGADILVQVHYAPWPVAEADQSSINLFFADEPVDRELKSRILLPTDLVDEDNEHFKLPSGLGAIFGIGIAAGVQDFLGVEVTTSDLLRLVQNDTLDSVFGDQLGGTVAGFLEFNIPANETKRFTAKWDIKEDISLLNVWPHMHYLGKDWEIVIERPDGTSENLIRIGEWDFNWQGSYTFARYIKAPAGSRILASATYDNTSRNPANPRLFPKDVDWGEKTTDEMYFLPFTYLDYEEGDEFLELDAFASEDNPAFRIESVTDDTVQFRLDSGGRDFIIEHSKDMRLWQTIGVNRGPAVGDWQKLTVPRGVDSAGFYRAVIYRD